MSHQDKHAEASLLYTGCPAPLDEIDTMALKSTIEALGFPVAQVWNKPGEYVLLTCHAMQILVAGFDQPFPLEHFRGVTCATDDTERQREVLSLLAAHGSSLTVLVLDHNERPPSLDPETKSQICRETVDLLMANTSPDLIFWSHEDQLFTAAEAEEAIEVLLQQGGTDAETFNEDNVQPRRPKNAVPPQTARPVPFPPPLRPGDIDLSATNLETAAFTVRPKRPSQAPSRTPRPAHLCVAPQLSQDVKNWFEGGPATILPKASHSKTHNVLRTFLALDDNAQPRRVSETASGRASIYLMSATIAVFALPVGASMLTYNALSGGSFRATSHMMALTGIGLALGGLGLPNPAAALGLAF